jgi:DMSO/TMAO reductase YedYZ heme-binding membrane subunit
MAVGLMLPAGVTSFDWAQRSLGRWWRYLHLLAVPAFGCSAMHIVLSGSNFWGGLSDQPLPTVLSLAVLILCAVGLLLRWRRVWLWFGLEQYYGKASVARGDRQ